MKLKNEDLLKDEAYIDGQWVKADGGKAFEVLNPADGSVVASVPDMGETETLKAIAAKTGGEYFWAGDRKKLADIYKRLDELSTHEQETVSHRPKRDLFYWPLGAALLLSLGYHLFMGIKVRMRNA